MTDKRKQCFLAESVTPEGYRTLNAFPTEEARSKWISEKVTTYRGSTTFEVAREVYGWRVVRITKEAMLRAKE